MTDKDNKKLIGAIERLDESVTNSNSEVELLAKATRELTAEIKRLIDRLNERD